MKVYKPGEVNEKKLGLFERYWEWQDFKEIIELLK